MSAIFGAFSRSLAPIDPELGARMNLSLSRRPADAVGHAVRGPCLLGARSFWVTPEAEQQLPVFFDGQQDLTLVADVRLDYREALFAALGDDLPRNLSDEALIAAAYARWGEDCVSHLEGDFAFALWDGRAQKLMLARDVYGVRALYYAEVAGKLLFASQASALFADPALERRGDQLRIAEYLARVFVDTSRTFYRGIQRLPPAHVLIADRTRVTLRRYFAFDGSRALSLPDTGAYIEAFRATFEAAVRTRARSRGETSCMLSGGLDSSGVVAMLKRLAPAQAVPCFSALFTDFPEIDEASWLALHEAEGGIALHTMRADRIGPLDDLDDIHSLLDEPFHAPNLFIYTALAKLTAERNVRVVLDGLDGDTVVEHGWFFLSDLLLSGRVRRLTRELRALHKRTEVPYRYMLQEWAFAPSVERLRAGSHALFPKRARHGYLLPEFAAKTGFAQGAVERARSDARQSLDFRAQHTRAIEAPLMPFYLEVHDKIAAAFGVDHRHPYFDRRMIELCLALPPEQRLNNGWDRLIQRRAFNGIVPPAICGRVSKSVWGENFRRQLFERNGNRVNEVLALRPSPLDGLADLDAMQRDLPRVRAGNAPGRLLDLWTAVTLGAWLARSNVSL